jgi:aminoglycoside phosphotransferase (APT) family kinase protein
MNTADVQMIAAHALSTIDEVLISIQLIETGSTSSAYKLQGEERYYVLRVPASNPRKRANYESDYLIRQKLSLAGQKVAAPINTNLTAKSQGFGIWSLDRFCDGEFPVRGKIQNEVSKQLGGLLRKLHTLPVHNFGMLEGNSGKLEGAWQNQKSGMLSRYESPWPFCSVPIKQHPAVKSNPLLMEAVVSIKDDLIRFLAEGTACITHSDLHEKQLLVQQGNLVALLDFNEAVALRREWDLGSFLYFHGRDCLQSLLDGYGAQQDQQELFDGARLAAILIALHHGNRGEILHKKHRIEAATKFLSRELL